MRIAFASEPGNPSRSNEDWVLVSSDLAVVLDGATARTDTGCVHGVAWFARQLGAAIVANAAFQVTNLAGCVANAIDQVARIHPQCDLTHPGTPSAAVGIVRVTEKALEYLVLGDVTVAIQCMNTMTVVTDDRVSSTAQPARSHAERLPIDSPEKAQALLAMKHGELAVRNTTEGYWVAANDPAAAEHAYVGQASIDQVSRVAILTDGASRAIAPFGLFDWIEAMELLSKEGPQGVIGQVRDAEEKDSRGAQWPRNKRSDDATAVYIDRIQLPIGRD